jgi:hypothetical protein
MAVSFSSRSTSRASILAIFCSKASTVSSMTETKEFADDDVSRGEEGVGDSERVESDAGEANWTMMHGLVWTRSSGEILFCC